MKNKVLVFGINGMLGSMVFKYLSLNKNLEVKGSSRIKDKSSIYFEVNEFLKNPNGFKELKKFDYIINCIGKIKPHTDENDIISIKNAILTNSVFPIELSKFLEKSNTKIIQIATDCVFSGGRGKYKESDVHNPTDVYGKTKSLGEVKEKNFLNIRCSIIGPEPNHKVSLLEWFLSQKNGSEILGFKHHIWNGVTTLQFARLCELIIVKNKFSKIVSISNTHHFIPNQTVNKFELMNILNEIYKKNLKVKPVDNIGKPIDRSLSSNFKMLSDLFGKEDLKTALNEIKKFK